MSGLEILFAIIILIFSVILHELAHGYAAYFQGDRTAAYAGRLTLNPFPHLDPLGSVILPAMLVLLGTPFVIGWAKPVPYNPYNLRNQRWGEAMVAAAGPATNIALAVIFGLLIRFGADGLLSPATTTIASFIVIINLVLAVFNLFPIPPLDGSKILFSILPYRYNHVREWLERYGLLIFILVIFFVIELLSPIVFTLFRLITGGGPWL